MPIGAHASDGPPPLEDVRDALDEPDPLALLGLASSLLAVLEPARSVPLPVDRDDGDPEAELPSLQELVASLMEVDTLETTALLAVFAELIDDDLLTLRMRRVVAERRHRLPRWLTGLAPLHISGALVLTHVLGDGDNVLLGVRTAAGDELTVVIYIDHNMGTVVKDAFVMEGSLETAAAQFEAAAEDDPDIELDPLDPAEARARVEAAIELGAMTWPPFETDTWPACRPLVAWVLRHLPTGGQGFVRPEWGDAERADLADRFFASPFGWDEDDPDGRSLLESLLWFGCDYGPGDPLRWSPVAVEILLTDWLPRKIVADVAYLSRAPDLLRAFVRFSHAQRGIRDELTAETLAAVDEWEDEYQRVIRSPRPQGPAALMAAMGMPIGDGPFGTDTAPWWPDVGYEQLILESLSDAVGGSERLQALEGSPLPDEPFAWDDIDDDVTDRVAAVLELVDGCCDALLDDEYRTACRRLLADVASADPDIFRRRGRVDTAAAAVVWIIGKANVLFETNRTGLAVADIVGWLGVSGSPSQRASTMLRALGVDGSAYARLDLGSPRYLVSAYRRDLIARRDRLQAELAVVDDDGDVTVGAADPPSPSGEPAQVATAVGWFPPDQFVHALDRWPELAQRWSPDDYTGYARSTQDQLVTLSRTSGRNPLVVPLEVTALEAYAERHDTDPAQPETRAAFAADAAQRDQGITWPPRRNDPCWCGSGRKYKRCCDTVSADRRFDR